MKYPNYKNGSNNIKKSENLNNINNPDDEIEEKIEIESKNSLNNSPLHNKKKALQ